MITIFEGDKEAFMALTKAKGSNDELSAIACGDMALEINIGARTRFFYFYVNQDEQDWMMSKFNRLNGVISPISSKVYFDTSLFGSVTIPRDTSFGDTFGQLKIQAANNTLDEKEEIEAFEKLVKAVKNYFVFPMPHILRNSLTNKSVLNCAIENGNHKKACILISNGANPYDRDEMGNIPVALAEKSGLFNEEQLSTLLCLSEKFFPSETQKYRLKQRRAAEDAEIAAAMHADDDTIDLLDWSDSEDLENIDNKMFSQSNPLENTVIASPTEQEIEEQLHQQKIAEASARLAAILSPETTLTKNEKRCEKNGTKNISEPSLVASNSLFAASAIRQDKNENNNETVFYFAPTTPGT